MKPDVYEAVARSLRDFGYPATTASQVADVHEAMRNKEPLPYGIVGMFAGKQLEQLEEQL